MQNLDENFKVCDQSLELRSMGRGIAERNFRVISSIIPNMNQVLYKL